MKNPGNIPDPAADFREKIDVPAPESVKESLCAASQPWSVRAPTAFFERSEKKRGMHTPETAGTRRSRVLSPAQLREKMRRRLDPLTRGHLANTIVFTNKSLVFIAREYGITKQAVSAMKKRLACVRLNIRLYKPDGQLFFDV